MTDSSLQDGLIAISQIAGNLLKQVEACQLHGSAASNETDMVGQVEDRPMFTFTSAQSLEPGLIRQPLPKPARFSKPALPDPRLVRRIIRQRQLRLRYIDAELVGDPVWDMLLDLTAARAEHKRVSVTSLCIASGVPPTTALRWIGTMVEAGLCERINDDIDRRRAFISLTTKGAEMMARLFDELGNSSAQII